MGEIVFFQNRYRRQIICDRPRYFVVHTFLLKVYHTNWQDLQLHWLEISVMIKLHLSWWYGTYNFGLHFDKVTIFWKIDFLKKKFNLYYANFQAVFLIIMTLVLHLSQYGIVSSLEYLGCSCFRSYYFHLSHLLHVCC